jgi:hypothetical protein
MAEYQMTLMDRQRIRGRGGRTSSNGPLEGAGHMRDSQDKG